jgi:hypothetical protein
LPVAGFFVDVVLKVFTGVGTGLATAGTAAELTSLAAASLADVRFGVGELEGIASAEMAVAEGAGRSVAGAGFSVFVDLAVCRLAVFTGPAESP